MTHTEIMKLPIGKNGPYFTNDEVRMLRNLTGEFAIIPGRYTLQILKFGRVYGEKVRVLNKKMFKENSWEVKYVVSNLTFSLFIDDTSSIGEREYRSRAIKELISSFPRWVTEYKRIMNHKKLIQNYLE